MIAGLTKNVLAVIRRAAVALQEQVAAHESPRTTKLYDPRADVVSLDEVEKVVF